MSSTSVASRLSEGSSSFAFLVRICITGEKRITIDGADRTPSRAQVTTASFPQRLPHGFDLKLASAAGNQGWRMCAAARAGRECANDRLLPTDINALH